MYANLPPKLKQLAEDALNRNASDLLLVPGEPPVFRVEGALCRADSEPLTAEDTAALAAGVLGDEELARIGPEVGNLRANCPLSDESNLAVCVARAGGCCTLRGRLVPTAIPTLAQVCAPEALIEAAESPNGLVIVSGLNGSGKTTTCYSLLDHLNRESACHICTVENPCWLAVRPNKALIQQREIGVDVPSCVAGLRAAMHQDPDVVFVGELTTVEELQACITVAETGHLVITQLHAHSPEAAIARIIDVFPEEMRAVARKTLASVLRAASTQCLLPREGGGGRVAAYGVLVPDAEMREAIAEGRDVLERQSPLPDGCQTLAEHIAAYVRDGVVTEQTAQRVLRKMNP
ncbi:MAG: Flp pilus assembly complex ATPase component TadA [Candidatus Hydrogenedentes bacterium]|nr:Flp pilus assembly complex ATPase component TadA [Candidatus Hydrogenedentota bacterium]